MKKIISKTITVALVVLSVTACSNKDKEALSEATLEVNSSKKTVSENQIVFTKAQYELANIETGNIVSRNLSSIIKLNGVIDVEPNSMATVSAPLGGYLKSAGLLPGEEVKKGQVLATIESPEFITIQQEYLENLGELEFLEAEYQRQKQLRDEDVNSLKTFQKIASEYKITQAKIKGYEQKITLAGLDISAIKKGSISRIANLYAPISGYVKTSKKNIGDYVNPQDVIFELVDVEDIHLALNAFENDLKHIEINQSVRFSLANENNFNRTANVFLVGKATDENRMTEVHCHIEGESKNLLPGMYVKAWVETDASTQQAVPAEALVQYEGKDFIIVETANNQNQITFKLEQINKAAQQEGYTAISGGNLAQLRNAKIVTKNAYVILSALRNATEEE